MLVARGTTELGRGRMVWAIGLSPRVWCLYIGRVGLALDTRYIPPSTAPANGQTCLYVLLRGRFDLHGVRVFEGPCAFILTMSQLEGADGARANTFRSTGAPYVGMELRLPESALLCDKTPNRPLALDATVFEAAASVAREAEGSDDSYSAAVGELVNRLAAAGVVSEAIRESASKTDAWPVRRVWASIKPMVETLSPASSLQDVSDGTGVSIRQNTRMLGDFLSRAAWGLGWRQITLHGRFKIAVLLLSAADASVDDVARIVGYASSNAMARAFRLAGLDSPSFIQEQLRQAATRDAL